MASACTTCNKSPPEVQLKLCGKCSKTPYCSRDCQKADWKVHKKSCAKQANGASSSPAGAASDSNGSPPKGLEGGVAKPFTRLDNGTWLHGRSEKDVFGLLIDAYRLRMDDMHKMEGRADADSLYGGAKDGSQGFNWFLDRVERAGLLPSWWNAQKREECEKFGLTSNWHDLRRKVAKADIIEHYGDGQFPMQLRMFGEAVYGTAPGGANGSAMRQVLMAMEQGQTGGMTASHLDISSMFGGR